MTEHRNFLRPGDALPAILLPHLNGGEVALPDFTGRKLLIFMWASW